MNITQHIANGGTVLWNRKGTQAQWVHKNGKLVPKVKVGVRHPANRALRLLPAVNRNKYAPTTVQSSPWVINK